MPSSLLDPIGFRLDGRPFYGFLGGDGDGGDESDDSDSDSDDGDDGDDDDKETVAGLKKTLQKITGERRAVRDEYRPYKAALRELGINSPEQLKERLGKGDESGGKPLDIEKVKAEARAEVQLEANRDLALARVEAAAKGMFQDPDDAVGHLSKNVDDLLGRDGRPDKNAIKRELEDLLAAKPHWGVGEKEQIGFDGGARQPGGGKVTMDGFLRGESARKRGLGGR